MSVDFSPDDPMYTLYHVSREVATYDSDMAISELVISEGLLSSLVGSGLMALSQESALGPAFFAAGAITVVGGAVYRLAKERQHQQNLNTMW